MKKSSNTRIYGVLLPERIKFDDSNLIEEHLRPATILQKIKIWFGTPKSSKEGKSLLGFEATYLNFINGKIYQSCDRSYNLEGDDIETKELEVKKNDYITRFSLGVDNYITHIKLKTKNGKTLEFGMVEKEFEKSLGLDNDNNIIQFLFGFQSQDGIRALGVKYISMKDFIFMRIFIFLRIRFMLKDDKNKKQYKDEKFYNNLDNEMKYILRTCLLPDTQFFSVIKFC